MVEPWTGEVVGIMHVNRIKQSQVADKMGVTNDWVSMILNGKKSPKGAEERIRAAIAEILEERKDGA